MSNHSQVNARQAILKASTIRLGALVVLGTLGISSPIRVQDRVSGGPRIVPVVRSVIFQSDPSLGYCRLHAKVGFKRLVFDGDRFPACELDRPSRLEDKLGPCTVHVTFFDRDGKTVETPATPGPYRAVVEVRSKDARPVRRFFTLYRTASKLPADARFNPSASDELSSATGIARKAIVRQKDLIAFHFRGRKYADLVNEPGVAGLLAGLSMTETEQGPLHKWNDADAADHRWWVRWKRHDSGLDVDRPHPFTGPKLIEGPPARMIREGTLAEAGMKPGTDEAIDAVLREWADDTDQAFAVCIARKGVIVLHSAYGTRNGKPMTVTTKSWMASVTKPMSASLMMMLVDDGRLTLDDRLSEVLPQLRPFTSVRPITIRHLYTHTHGLENWIKGHDEMPDFEERIADFRAYVRPGRAWNYNGTGYTLGGKIIEAISGESLPDFYGKHLLQPLGCDNTDVFGTHADMWSIPLDIAKFGQMLLNEGAYGDMQFFRPETFRQMLPRRLTSVLGPDAKKVFGIGLDGTDHQIGHGAASGATFQINRDDDLVVVMTRNAIGKNYDKYNGKFWDAIKAGIK